MPRLSEGLILHVRQHEIVWKYIIWTSSGTEEAELWQLRQSRSAFTSLGSKADLKCETTDLLQSRQKNQNQNQNCYWWHVQMTIIHQDLWWGKLVPSPYKRSELSNRVFCSFSSRKESICKWVPISNSLGKEAALVNVSISKGGLKCQRVVISDMPNWGGQGHS